ncbi:UNVERIFIED_CONTAM: hypothetical protein FKN15_078067 [Acipenser sinensis]
MKTTDARSEATKRSKERMSIRQTEREPPKRKSPKERDQHYRLSKEKPPCCSCHQKESVLCHRKESVLRYQRESTLCRHQ